MDTYFPNKQNTAASIITFNPDIDILLLSLSKLQEEVSLVLIIDNASDNLNSFSGLVKRYSSVVIVEHKTNEGIGKRLNEAVDFAISKNKRWLLLLDQDSVICQDYVHKCQLGVSAATVSSDEIAILSPTIALRNAIEKKAAICQDHFVKSCITSGSLLNINVCKQIGDFNNDFFIDCIDEEYSIRVLNHGKKILCVPSAVLSHDLGSVHIVRIFGYNLFLYPDKPLQRQYYMARNGWIIRHKYLKGTQKIKAFVKEVLTYFLTMKLVKDKKQWRMIHRMAVHDAKRNIMGKTTRFAS
ncbi:MAG: hypothetical protein LKE31_02780 [Bacilli bacterium]|jgi:rhamnosyltransferase|nr:hypothetical protein [Bacilli bacterium]